MEHKHMAMEQGELSQPPQYMITGNSTQVGSLCCADQHRWQESLLQALLSPKLENWNSMHKA